MICNRKRPQATADVCDKRYCFRPTIMFFTHGTLTIPKDNKFNRRGGVHTLVTCTQYLVYKEIV